MSDGDLSKRVVTTKRKLDDHDIASPKRANLRVVDDDDAQLVATVALPPIIDSHGAVTRVGEPVCARPSGITHDPVRPATYVTDFRGNVRRLGDGSVFCCHLALKGARCAPESHRSADCHLVGWTDTAVDAVSEGGGMKLLAGSEGIHGTAYGRGTDVRFHDITCAAFDGIGRIVVLDDGADRVCRLAFDGAVTAIGGGGGTIVVAAGSDTLPVTEYRSANPSVAVDRRHHIYVSGTHREALRRIDGATGAETIARFARPSDGATMRRPRSLVYDPEGDRLFVADGARIWTACARTRALEVLVDLGVWEPNSTLALSTHADWRDEKLALALEPDARHVADICAHLSAIDWLRRWPPGLTDLVVQYARPGLHILVARRGTGDILRVAIGPPNEVATDRR